MNEDLHTPKEEYLDDVVVLTPIAARYIKKYCDEKNSVYEIRLQIRGGGCSGFKNDFDIKTEDFPDDNVFEQYGIKIYVDSKSAVLLKGSTLDYQLLKENSFKLINDKFKHTCGCGSSFSY